ncbi:MAG: hypothetical protein QMC80_03710 [Thermoplasmatales archaeon]|nr:hypothetical protein [Thermoplasmatales archaeon]
MEMSVFCKAILYFDDDFDSDAEGMDNGYEIGYVFRTMVDRTHTCTMGGMRC